MLWLDMPSTFRVAIKLTNCLRTFGDAVEVDMKAAKHPRQTHLECVEFIDVLNFNA